MCSEDDASYYAESVRRGGALVTVRADDSRADEAASVMRNHGAVDIERRAEQWKQQGWTRHDPSATPYSVDQLERERSTYGSLGKTSDQNFGVGSQMGADTTTSGMGVTSTSSTWSDDEDFRTHYSDYLSSTGGTYEDYEPAYRYGSDLGRNAALSRPRLVGDRIRCTSRLGIAQPERRLGAIQGCDQTRLGTHVRRCRARHPGRLGS